MHGKYWHRQRRLNEELKHGNQNPNPVDRERTGEKKLPPKDPKPKMSVKDFKKLTEFSC